MKSREILRMSVLLCGFLFLLFAFVMIPDTGFAAEPDLAIFDGSTNIEGKTKSVDYSSVNTFTLKGMMSNSSGSYVNNLETLDPDYTNWSSSNTNVVTVSNAGVVTIKLTGSATITCTYRGAPAGTMQTFTSSCTIKVTGSIAYITKATPSATVAYVGDSVSWSITKAGGYGTTQFIYRLYKGSTSGSPIRQTTSTSTSFSYTFDSEGAYYLQIQAIDGRNNYSSRFTAPVVNVYILPEVNSVALSSSTLYVGDQLTFTVGASGGTGSYSYFFKTYKDGAEWITTSTYDNYFSFSPASPGLYYASVSVADGNKVSDTMNSAYVTVYSLPYVSEVTASDSSVDAYSTVTWTITAGGGAPSDLEYHYGLYKDNALIEVGYSGGQDFQFVLAEPGTYRLEAFVKDCNGRQSGTVVSSDVYVQDISLRINTDLPEEITIDLGNIAILEMDVDNGLEYHWQYSEDNGETWTDLSVIPDSDYWLVIKGVPHNFRRIFRCMVVNKVGEYILSNVCHLYNSGNTAPDVAVLPSDTKAIESEAFYGSGIKGLCIPEGCLSIGDNAFSDCPDLEWVYIPASVRSISNSAFINSHDVLFYTTSGSHAESWLSEKGYTFINY